MKILVASAFFESHRGGVEIVAGELVRQFRLARQAVTWMAAGANSIPSGDLSERRVPLAVYQVGEKFFGFRLPIPGWTALQSIRREVTAADAVMIHDALYPTNIAIFLFARWLGKPVVLTQQTDTVSYSNPVLRWINDLVTRRLLAAAEQAVFVSRLTAEKFKGVAFRRPPRLIFGGVDTDLFRPAYEAAERESIRKEFGLPSDRPVALLVARFVDKKGLHILRQAAQESRDITWVLAGRGNVDPNEWQLDNVKVITGADHTILAPLYRASDVFVMPGVSEGFPLALQEAAVCGLPSVCRADMVKADGRLAPMLYPVSIEGRTPADAAKYLLSSVRLAVAEHEPAHAALRAALVSGWYSWEQSAQRYLELFSDVLVDAANSRQAADMLPSASR